MTHEDVVMFIGYCTCGYFSAEAINWLIASVKRLIAHIKAKTDTPSIVVYLDGVPIGTMEVDL